MNTSILFADNNADKNIGISEQNYDNGLPLRYMLFLIRTPTHKSPIAAYICKISMFRPSFVGKDFNQMLLRLYGYAMALNLRLISGHGNTCHSCYVILN